MKQLEKRKQRAVLLFAICTLCVTLLFGGTFAWSSLGQNVTNEVKGHMENPGGRLHDDFNGKNKDVYIENFTDQYDGQPIIVRIRLREHMEMSDTAGTNVPVWSTWDVWDPMQNIQSGCYESPTGYWKWKLGGQTTYLPTFNKDLDSQVADVNGTFAGPDGNDADGSDSFEDYVKYAINTPVSGTAKYNGGTTKTETHIVSETQSAVMMSMAQWSAAPQLGQFWVYDNDGWAYWAQPLWPDSATGLLLDEISLTKAIRGNWYYGIHVEAEMVTADELADIAAAKADQRGFYHSHDTSTDACKNGTCSGECPSSTAAQLLSAIVKEIGENPSTTYQWMTELMSDIREDEEETEAIEETTVVNDQEESEADTVLESVQEESEADTVPKSDQAESEAGTIPESDQEKSEVGTVPENDQEKSEAGTVQEDDQEKTDTEEAFQDTTEENSEKNEEVTMPEE